MTKGVEVQLKFRVERGARSSDPVYTLSRLAHLGEAWKAKEEQVEGGLGEALIIYANNRAFFFRRSRLRKVEIRR